MITNFSLTLRGACLALCLVAATPAWALGLGEIKSNSTLFGPLSAQIELNGASSVDLRQLSIRFGSVDEYLQIGERRSLYLSVIELSIGRDSRGNPVIHLDSQHSIDVAVLGLLIRVTTPRGQIQKFYNLLLDPPNWDMSDDGRRFITSSVTRQSETSIPQNTVLEADADDARQEQTIERGALTTAGRDTLIAAGPVRDDWYGPVRSGDRIILIARRTRLDRSISINQIMLAYLRANPAAFKRGNLNGTQLLGR